MNRESIMQMAKVAVIGIAGAVVGLVLAFIFPPSMDGSMHGIREFKLVYYPVNMALSFSSLFLLTSLLRLYLKDYMETRARFMLGLVIFLLFLTFQAVFSIPLLHMLLGFSSIKLGPFSVVPAFFETVALSIFLYLSMEDIA